MNPLTDLETKDFEIDTEIENEISIEEGFRPLAHLRESLSFEDCLSKL